MFSCLSFVQFYSTQWITWVLLWQNITMTRYYMRLTRPNMLRQTHLFSFDVCQLSERSIVRSQRSQLISIIRTLFECVSQTVVSCYPLFDLQCISIYCYRFTQTVCDIAWNKWNTISINNIVWFDVRIEWSQTLNVSTTATITLDWD